MRELDTMVLRAKDDQNILAELIRQNEYHILQCASKTTRRYITKSDDEWSVSLLAFTQAVQSYELSKGNFIKFADLVIKRRLIDFIRSQGKYSSEICVDPVVFDTEPEEDDDVDTSIRIAVAEQVSKTDSGDLKLEISTVNNIFQEYGFSFFDLVHVSPQARKTKASCAKAVNYILNNPMMITELRNTKLLPIKIIEKNAQVPRKILERHRKYIIAAIEILSGGYPNLAEYLHYIREENGK
jgi:RNA polymerase sigma factor